MELRHLRYFVAVAEELHFGRAAQRLHVAQPSLSEQIKRLERELGVVLLERGTRRVTLTEAGRVFFDEARIVLRRSENAIASVISAGRGDAGQLSIGFVGAAVLDTLPSLMRRFRSTNPGVSVSFQELPLAEQVERIRDNNLDVGIVRQPQAITELSSLVVQSDPLVVVLHEGHPLLKHESLTLQNLANEQFLMFARQYGPAFYDRIIVSCVQAGFSPKIVQEVRAMITMVGLAAAEVGIAIIPSVFAQSGFPGVGFRKISPPLTLDTGLIWNPSMPPGKPALQAFVDCASIKAKTVPQKTVLR